ncbi:MAG: HDOD domain-containing protein [Acidimicrobiia bacterium]|nr:HDOD domain-containing protein [Acidimicrobiia bacterium]
MTRTNLPDVEEITRLPVAPGAGMRLLWRLDDPTTSAAEIGSIVEADPALSMQVIRLANTAFYGLSRQVGSAWRAVTVLGLATVRALATSAAFDLFAEKGRAVPEGFWRHSVTTAASASVVARRVGVPPNDAFSTGLLLDIGAALMFRRARHHYDLVLARVAREECTLVEAEEDELGTTHAEIGALVLESMRFPPAVVEAVEHHHTPFGTGRNRLALVAALAEVLAREVMRTPPEADVEVRDVLGALGLGVGDLAFLRGEVAVETEALAGFLTL